MARYKVILAYDGAAFHGSQRQAGGRAARTVQGELERALRNLGWRGTSVIMAGRTDAGVHAAGQVAAFEFEWTHSDERLLKALNGDLGQDAAIQAVCAARADFHPRFDAISRTYRYELFCAPIRDPLREKFSWRVWPAVDAAVLRKCAKLFVGRHDFAAFGSATTASGSTTRRVETCGWRNLPGNSWQFEVRADAFLYRMVRRMVFVQVAVAQGRGTVEQVRKAIKSSGKLPSGIAPAHGLTLIEIKYDETER